MSSQKVRFAVIIFVALLSSLVFAKDFGEVVVDDITRVNIDQFALLIEAGDQVIPENLAQLRQFVQQHESLDAVSTSGSQYWYIFNTVSEKDQLVWFNISNRLLKHIRLYLVTEDEISLVSETGLSHAPQYPLTYAQQFIAPQGEATWIIEIEHPYLSGNPRIILFDEYSFKKSAQYNLMIVIGCIGTILLLAPYNLLIGLWSRNRAYFWYAAYLICVSLQWMTFFNIWDHFLGLRSDFFNFTFFNLYVFCGTNFYLSFLRIDKKHTILLRLSKLWRYNLLMVPGYFVWPVYVHYALLNLVVGGWIILGLICGIVSYREGYRPARFFIMGFSLIAFMVILTILAQAHILTGFDNTYRWTLVTQTLDVILLSLALADQINLLRKEKVEALQSAFEKEKTARLIEEQASRKLIEANSKLDTALRIANEDRQSKQRYMRVIGHELKTPLHTIFAILDNSEQDKEFGPNERMQLSMATDTLRRHISNLLSLAETASGGICPLTTDVDLRQITDELVAEMRKLFGENTNLSVEGLDALPERVMTDGILLRHVYFELLHNAVKFSHGKPVNIKFHYEGDLLKLAIEDRAGGFPEAMVAEYSQKENGLTRNSSGLGIGLTVAANLLEVLGSQLKIAHPTPDASSVSFALNAPRLMEEAEIGPLEAPLHCLVVEDNLFNQKLLVKILTKLGHSAVGADDGQIAVEKSNKEEFDVVFMDVQMPIMDGIEATRRIREAGHQMPIIVVTANTEYEVRAQIKQAGANRIIGKPINKNAIQSVLQ